MQAFAQFPCPALVTDRAGIIQSVNQELLLLVGGDADSWRAKPMDQMFPLAGRIFLQTHIWPMLVHEGRVREIRLQLLAHEGPQVPVFVNAQKVVVEGVQSYAWILFVTLERSRYEQELLALKQRAEAVSLELARSERFVRTVTDAMPGMIAYWDTDMRCQFANKPCIAWFGKQDHGLLGLTLATVLGERPFQQHLPYIQKTLAGAAQEFEHSLDAPDGSLATVMVNYIPDQDASGVVKGFFALTTNISRLREADAAVRLTASVFEATTEGILVADPAGHLVSVNPACCRLTGYSEAQLLGQPVGMLVSERHEDGFFSAMLAELQATGIWRGDVWTQRRDGSVFRARLSLSTLCSADGQLIRYVGVGSDITDQWGQEQVVRQLALHDGLTGLPNRNLLMERLGHLIARSVRESRQIALMFLDLDGFKEVNDTWGHAIGDQVLKTVATRLSGLVRQSDTVARLGGDEFVLLLDNPDNQESIESIAARVIALVAEPVCVGELRPCVGASMGIAVYQQAGESAQTFLKRADDAMYAAKAAGKSGYRFAP